MEPSWRSCFSPSGRKQNALTNQSTPHLEFTVGGLHIYGEMVDESEVVTDSEDRAQTASKYPFESSPSANESDFVVSTNAQVRKLSLIDAKLIKSPDFLRSGDEAANIMLINGVFNCVGRLFFSFSSDLVARNFNIEHAFARKCVFYTTLVLQVVIVGTTPKLIRKNQYTAFVVEIFVLMASYDGGFGTIPAFLTDMFGAFNKQHDIQPSHRMRHTRASVVMTYLEQLAHKANV
ncbi:Major Facilitator Superfamily (MFS) [Phytophthora cinnamomi]|uniref:Major Facilitator Superfamily (MFS) n=1 Tax=Phytophthora cinnamomi TaxID=4785 RepID=UPI003559F629|nr:Major Facilitator Superfamily (MFS) [Phytophthora cinnamomi]